MAKIGLIVFLVSSLLYSFELKTGDVLLQPLSCYSCRLISSQEDSKFSHVGLYLKVGDEDLVIEAYGKVKLTPLRDYLARTAKDKEVKVIRLKKSAFVDLSLIEASMDLVGQSYDSDFLLNNFDDKGEKLYCSELIYKVYKELGYDIGLKKMSFDKNREAWIRFFKGNPPDGELGISPEDLNKSLLFDFIGLLR